MGGIKTCGVRKTRYEMYNMIKLREHAFPKHKDGEISEKRILETIFKIWCLCSSEASVSTSLTCRQVVAHASHGRLGADLGGVVVFGQLFAFGESEVAPVGHQNSPPLIVLDGRPIVEAEMALEGNAILLAYRKTHGVTVVQSAIGEGVLAQ